jgi:chromosome segregation protein
MAMKIHSIELSGFRGIRRFVSIPCGSGFTVICGPNGSGKSTICDALEFLLTDTLERFSIETERREYIADYMWWRGKQKSDKHRVAIELQDEASENALLLERGPTSAPSESSLARLIDASSAPSDWKRQLCLTTILRDETIAKFSTDQSERERSEFTLSSIGLAGSVEVERRIALAVKVAESSLEARTRDYDDLRAQVERCIAELSQARALTARASEQEFARLRAMYSRELDQSKSDFASITRAIAEACSSLKRRQESLTRMRARYTALIRDRSEIETETFRQGLDIVKQQVARAKDIRDQLQRRADELRSQLRDEQAESPLLSSIALLAGHGGRLGLDDGCCPLCGSRVSELDFRRHLESLEERVQRSSALLSRLVMDQQSSEQNLTRASAELASIEAEFKRRTESSSRLDASEQSLRSEAAHLGVELGDEVLAKEIALVDRQLIERTNDLATLQAMASLSRIPELEESLRQTTKNAEAAERRLSTATRLRLRLADARDVVKRVSTEIIAERLASIKPTLVEFCERLRPHPEWAIVEMLLRGEVRPFVSFLVGESLNPRFVFSSGQRRALGLAFLLSMHLSRTWSNLDTLILDDPVQHIDDYRALHLIETLASMRMLGRQIICTVEDSALADLLCRRLRSSASSQGVRIDLEYSTEEAVVVKKTQVIAPLASSALAAD